MGESNAWGTSRRVVFVVVLAVHAAVFGLLWAASRIRIPAGTELSIELMFLPPPPAQKVHFENLRPQRMSTQLVTALAAPVLNSATRSNPASVPEGQGAAVNWVAEAHRALQAFEIRRDQPPNSAQSVSPALDEWWSNEHHAGDEYKTASGDWIVWIDARCYQLASWRSNAPEYSASQRQTICPAKGGTPRN